MQIVQLQPRPLKQVNRAWLALLFSAKAAKTGGVVRRSVRDTEREVGRAEFAREVQRRGFHLLECGGQFIVICRKDHLIVHD